ncbi:PAS domain S-box protein [Desulfolutivibrio sulfodismutans DSM 3696]|nr:PAS domain S-box protein [Desulfolutivibrio sulfodismutans DSM 3696]
MNRSGMLRRIFPFGLSLREKILRRRARVIGKKHAPPDLLPPTPQSCQPIFSPPLPQDHNDYAVLIRPDGRILSCDKALPRRLGVGLQEFIGADIYSFFDPGIAMVRKKAVAAAIKTGESLRYRDESKPGRVYDTRILPVFDKDDRLSSLAIFVGDISAEERAKRERRKLAAGIEQSVDAVIIADMDFNIEYVNQSFEAMTGYSRREAFGRNLGKFYKTPQQEEKFKMCVELLTKGESCSNRFLLVSKDGDVCVCDQSVSPVRARYGVILGYVFVWRDATQVSKLEKQLRQAQKMEAIGALASGIAHDFNNILGPIILHTELCLSKTSKDDPIRASLPEILDAAKRARALVEQLLHLGRSRGRDTPIPFRLSTLVKECTKLLAPGFSPGIRIRLQFETQSDLTLADPDQVHQVILNLATNAADAMKEFGGVLTFTISNQAIGESDWSRHPGLPAGEYICLTATDTGHGISPICLKKIFEPFYSTKTRTGGMGLGLSVVQNIVARMRGSISVESEPGLGTSFHVLLPKAHAPEAEAPAPPHTRRPLRKTPRILFVDDEEALVGSLGAALKGLGYAVECRVTAAEALGAFLHRPDGYDLAMIDYFMPHMNGLELARELWRVRPGLSVVLFSAYADKIPARELEHSGIKAFLPKPFDLESLEKTIAAVCGEATSTKS